MFVTVIDCGVLVRNWVINSDGGCEGLAGVEEVSRECGYSRELGRSARVQIPALPLGGCVALGWLLNLSGRLSPNL